MSKRTISIFLPVFLLIFILTGCAATTSVKKTSRVVITAIDVMDNTVKLKLNGKFAYTVYKPHDPFTVMVDLPGVGKGDIEDKIVSDKAGISEVTVTTTETPALFTKVQILLDSPSDVEPEYVNNSLIIRAKKWTAAAEPEETVPPAAETAEAEETVPPAAETVEPEETVPPAAETVEPEEEVISPVAEAVEAEEAVPPAAETVEPEEEVISPVAEAVEAEEAVPPAAETAEPKETVPPAAETVEPEEAVPPVAETAEPEEAVPPVAEVVEAQKATPPVVEPLPQASVINDVGFDYSDGTLKLIIKGNGLTKPNIYTLENRIVVDIPGVAMKAKLPDAVISPVTAVRYGKHRKKIRLVFDLKKEMEFTAQTVDNTIVIALPVEEAPPEEKVEVAGKKEEAEEGEKTKEKETVEEKKYKGKIISLDFQNADIVPIFRFLGDVAGYNVVINPAVSGRITLKLMNVPWDQALHIILQTFNLSSSIEGNILTIAPSSVFEQMEKTRAKLKETRRRVAEVKREDIRLEHIEASKMVDKIKEAKVISPRGTIRLDDRLNALIVIDTEENIAKVKEEINYWDTPEHRVMQVMIEAKIASVESSSSKSFNIKWGGSAPGADISFMSDSVTADFSVNTPPVSAGRSKTVDGTSLNLGFNIGTANALQIELSLDALETVRKSKTLANPKVLTMDGQSASITQGTTIFVPTTTAEGTGFQQVAASLNLNVTPTIKRHDFVELTVSASSNEPGEIAGGTISVSTKNVTTKALVKNGETLVLGGIYTKTELESETRVPILHRIPILGWFFKIKKNPDPTIRELLIFITPRIIK